ncbi:hypothetical protein Syn7803C76_174 [Synechococcus phage ACG-2014b]|jgi:hypothetical protein|uniref:Uncharacterized protein n=2 Tax=Synechococcus phage ACG-2014b TaxID=1493508 RepID=A0A0E3G546_9CAUD|nr:hypothetical protein ABF04_gp174 [Synechococcus phage ACG-2014b]YP_009779800.1 hypothetical protein HOQ67_gp172 [Synechococcus phage ACG-2014b]YP_009780018.1 hypothetical protein HOQ68_gp175 [Synechococcus phage ACG-2014b]AIX17394.1 hypothetical protein Syn7803C61_172 [Synechococcus phage ACG-2014b]AIX17609.1 hypothetical protein Syn7803C66_172 [Synechococcus phage ACG-2014b]AIX17825.1 hypothetical protein Syn7803C67_173 [Synechococcus phage ACG-2014b]AIX18041.1 hypothetical protein Syn780
MSSAESNKTSQKTPSQDSLYDQMLTEAGQEGNPLAEVMWDNEKRKQRQQEERNTRHSVDKGQDFVDSGMTLITDIESDRYLNKNKNVSN